MITIIFDDDVDFYFARERVLERLTLASTFLPQGVVPYLAPDATALGQIFWYTVEGRQPRPGPLLGHPGLVRPPRAQLRARRGRGRHRSAACRKEYQIDVDPNKLRAYGITLGELYDAVARSNSAVGGRVIQKGNAEYLVRSVGWIEDTRDIENTVVTAARRHADSTSRTWPASSSAPSSAAASSRRTATRSSAAWS